MEPAVYLGIQWQGKSFFCLSIWEAINEVFRATVGLRLRLEVVNKVPDKRLYPENLLSESSLKEGLGNKTKTLDFDPRFFVAYGKIKVCHPDYYYWGVLS